MDSYTVWTSKRFDTNIYAEQFKWGRNKERYAKRIKEQWQVRFIRELEQIQTLIYSNYTRPMRLSKEESERLLDWLHEGENE